MKLLLLAAVALLSFANGSNDNFKGVATLWGAGIANYRRALAWATGFTFLGSVAAIWLARGLVAKFNGSSLLPSGIYTQAPFLAAVALGAAATVLLASWLGMPISTTHALTGALVGAGVMAAGFSQVRFVALGKGVVVPLLFSPLAALGLTLMVYPLLRKMTTSRDCICIDEPRAAMALATEVGVGPASFAAAAAPLPVVPALRWAPTAECATGAEVARFQLADGLHWASGAAISFARGLNDTPKIAASLLVLFAAGAGPIYFLVALAIAAGGVLGAARVARTMSKQITPMAAPEAVSANLVAAVLVTLASRWGLPVSTTHVTSGGLFGIGMLRRNEADWKRVREILLSWMATLPIGTALAAGFYLLLAR
jgi:PiT family inorganic phosphate transporter